MEQDLSGTRISVVGGEVIARLLAFRENKLGNC
jgi:hypothetical protein